VKVVVKNNYFFFILFIFLVGLQSSNKKIKAGDDDDSLSMSPSRSEDNSSQIDDEKNQKTRGMKNTYENMFKLMSIEEMICESIMSVENPELRKRLSNSILLVGGGAKFKGIIDYLEDRLIDKLTTIDPQIERVEIINFPTVDSKTLTWIGGTIIPKLDSSKDMWIMRDRWVLDIDRFDEKEKDLPVIKEIKENPSGEPIS
jgi:actin-related protein